METKILTIFTRTPLHVGAGLSVGAIDQPIIRERHTRFPVIPGSSVKGVMADLWTDDLVRKEEKKDDKTIVSYVRSPNTELTWLFGEEDAKAAAAGALLFGEAKLMAFPVRSAKGGVAWATSPLVILRAIRDGALSGVSSEDLQKLSDPGDEKAYFNKDQLGLSNNGSAVLEDQPLNWKGDIPRSVTAAYQNVMGVDPFGSLIAGRLIVVSDGTLTFLTSTACEVAQHVHINDATGTAASGALFNQENVPAETLFYSVLNVPSRVGQKKQAEEAISALSTKIAEANSILQFGGDASSGLGYCTVTLA